MNTQDFVIPVSDAGSLGFLVTIVFVSLKPLPAGL